MTQSLSQQRSITDQMAAISGAEHTRVHGNVMSVAPADTSEISSVLRGARAEGLAVMPRGAGTKEGWMNAGRVDLTILTGRMNTVREHTWQDMTCTVEAGCEWSAMQLALAEHGQFVALDPLWPERATVGGVVATNDSGALRLRYGGLRDLIIGMTIVLADGTIAKTGGKVVKNVAGYDLHKLMCGAFGTLGVITEVTFRLHSIPKHTASLTFSSTSVEALGRMLLRVLDSHYSAQSMQLRAESEGFALDVQLSALPDVLTAQSAALSREAEEMQLETQSSSNELWLARQRQIDGRPVVTFKATMLPTEIVRTSNHIQMLGGTAVTQANGIMTGSFPLPDCAASLGDVRTQLELTGGSLTLLNVPQDFDLERWGDLSGSLRLMRELKNRFDPHAVLNPRRVFGEI